MQAFKNKPKTSASAIIQASSKSPLRISGLAIWCFLLFLASLSKIYAQETPESLRIKQLYYDAATQKVLQNWSKALNLYAEITRLYPQEAAAYYEAGHILSKHSIENALPYAKKAYYLDPSQKWYGMLYAFLLDEQNQHEESARVHLHLFRNNPQQTDLAFEAADRLAKAKSWKEADALYYELALSEELTDEAVRGRLSLLRRFQKPKKYLKAVKKMFRAYPNQPFVLGAYAEALKENGKTNEAIAAFNQLKQKHPKDPKVDLALAKLYQENGLHDSAFAYIRAAFTKDFVPMEHKITILNSYMYLAKNNESKAEQIDELLDLLEQGSDIQEPSLLLLLAQRRLDQNRFGEALNYFIKASHFGNCSYDVWNQILRLEAYLGKWKQLETHANRAAIAFPNQPMPYLFSATALRYSGQFEEAIEILLTGMAYVLPEDMETRIKFHGLLSELYHEKKDYASSDAELEQAIQLRRTHGGTLNTYARNLAEREERLSKALEMAELAVKISPENPEFIATKAFVLLKLNRLDESRIGFNTALQLGGDDNFRVLEQMGDLEAASKNLNKALEYWTKSRDESIYPREELLEKIEKAQNQP